VEDLVPEKDKPKAEAVQDETLKTTMTATTATSYTRESFFSRMKPFHGSFSDDSLVKMLIRPFFCLLNPAITWAILIVAFASVWVIGISIVIAQIFSAPPFLLNTAQLGYIGAGPTAGGFLGCILCGALSDPIARFFTRRNMVYTSLNSDFLSWLSYLLSLLLDTSALEI
jgi:hypothetical protein